MSKQKSFLQIMSDLMIKDAPAYANKLYYSLGFLSMISFVILIITGVVMVFYGPNWWLTSNIGVYFRSVHLWATQAFVLFVILHLLIVFFTSGFKKPRRLTWVIGALMFIFLLVEGEFGYVLRGDFSSQWRSLQGADLWNGSGIGSILNSLNYKQIYGIHIAIIPFGIVFLLFLHYLLVKVRGIAKPYRSDVHYTIKKANHKTLFIRGGVLIVLILLLGKIFPSPFVAPTTIKQIAQQDPQLMASTLVSELSRASDTATYTDNISPYTFDTAAVYVNDPYTKLLQVESIPNYLSIYNDESSSMQQNQINSASDYFTKKKGALNTYSLNPVISVVSALTTMAQTGLYESVIASSNPTSDNTTYTLRFLSDTGVLSDKAQALGITTPQYGMLHEESSTRYSPTAWWLAPLGLLDNQVLNNDDNQDRDGAIIIGLFFILLVAFPYIPGLNQLPDKLKVYKIIWREKNKKIKS